MLKAYSDKKDHMQYGSVNNLRLDEFNNPDYMKILDSEMAILNKDQLDKFQSLT